MRGRGVTGTTLLLLVPLVPLLLFGVARAEAPFSLLGLVFHHPWAYALVAAAVVVAGSAAMSLRWVEARAARVPFGMADLLAAAVARRTAYAAGACAVRWGYGDDLLRIRHALGG